MIANEAIEKLQDYRLVFTVTSGRSGSKLLTALASVLQDVKAVHEAHPRMNYVMRGVLSFPEAAKWWLESEMYPSVAAAIEQPVYLETSHLFCKGFIEPTIQLGLRPDFIVLKRSAHEVAASLYSINCIPERTGSGRLVLLGPSDTGVWKVPDWEKLSDYQLCFWYAREIERRQEFYTSWLPTRGCDCFSITLEQLTQASNFGDVARFLTGTSDPIFEMEEVNAVLQKNQNPQAGLATSFRSPLGETDRIQQEVIVDELMHQNPYELESYT